MTKLFAMQPEATTQREGRDAGSKVAEVVFEPLPVDQQERREEVARRAARVVLLLAPDTTR